MTDDHSDMNDEIEYRRGTGLGKIISLEAGRARLRRYMEACERQRASDASKSLPTIRDKNSTDLGNNIH